MNQAPQNRQDRGIALVVVLTFLVLLTVFAVAFLTSVTNDAQSSYTYAKGVQTQQLTQSAINIAMAQIKAATTNDKDTMWTSQPGMIKTYAVPAGNTSVAKDVTSYRLFSSSSMILKGTDVKPEDEVAVQQRKEWPDFPAHMVDLNKPASDALGNLVYPILDPRAADGPEKIEGFVFDREKIKQQMGDKFFHEPTDAPMPVRWLYMLAKGDIVSGRETDKTTASFDAATKDNPVVGRIAFWTDDESCKVNINTAAGDEWTAPSTTYGPSAGSYWDVPRTFSAFDKQALANFQPAQGEYQRYPGHPATTYLSAVFPKLTSAEIGKITSRVQRGGSLGGTALASGKITPDADRLYASIDELIFDPNRNEQPLTKQRVERGRFFLTANSRSPEANLFNRPRVAIWPVNHLDIKGARSPYDRLIAFCSTIKNQPYFFDRSDADSPTADYSGRNVDLYGYLQRLTSDKIPGFSPASFETKYTTADRNQILTEIFDYIRSTNLFDDTIEPLPYTYPTKGLQFTNRRTSQTGVDPGHGQVTPLRIGTTQGFGRFYTVSEAALHFIATADPATSASNVAKDAANPSLTGVNRTLQTKLLPGERRIEAMLLLEMFSPSQGWTGLVPDMQVRIRGLDSLQVNSTPLKFPADGTVRMTMSGTSTYHGRAWGGSAGFRFQLNSRKLPARGIMPSDASMNDGNKYPFVSIPVTIKVAQDGTMNFSGGSLILEVYSGTTTGQSAGNLVQTINLSFPQAAIPAPLLVTTGTPEQVVTAPATPASSATSPEDWWTFSSDGAVSGHQGRVYHSRFAPGSTNKPEEGAFIRNEDTIRSLLPSHGDYRLIAARQTVPASVFTPHSDYMDTSVHMAHSLMEAVGFAYVQGPDTGGKLVDKAPYDSGHVPDIREDIDVNSRTRLNRGDWDTGVAYVMDGPYINKPDEGNSYRGTGASIPYFDNNQAQEAGGPTFFSPNRQIPSSVTFGSLPTGIFADGGAGRSWRTLLFRPDTNTKLINPNGTAVGQHDGAKIPKDHLLLDLFWMPVVEPYAISEPFSTAGKINMNYQIAPFTYFKRTTGLRALLRSERVVAIPQGDAGKYKGGSAGTYRFEIDADETLKQFDDHLSGNASKKIVASPFKSPSEICEQYLVPKGATLDQMEEYWKNHILTGDNVREHPYATLYPRLTTKSNVYTVHYCVQTLRQANRGPNGDWKTWDEKKDVVTGESRGSTIIERYVDLEDPDLPDFATLDLNSKETLDQHCKIRVLMNRKFNP